MTLATYRFPTLIHAGPNARARLPDALLSRGLRRPLIVTDRGVAALPLLGQVRGVLEAAGLQVSVFAQIAGNPVTSQVLAGVACYRDVDADAIVALGGGAALDVAKCLGLLVHHPGDLFDYEDELPGGRPMDRPMPCLLALPTTAGTGSEVGCSAVIADDHTHVKKIIFGTPLLPVAVFADAELTVGLPAAITAATGLDALTHLIEAYLAKNYQPMCDGIALEGLRLVRDHLPQAVDFATRGEGPSAAHLAARAGMLDAAMMGAVAFQKGLGVCHACAHALSAVCDLHHGLANGILLDHALAFNAEVAEGRFVTMAKTLELSDATSGGFLSWLTALKSRLGIPATLSQVGVREEHVGALVDCAVADPCHKNNPREVSRQDFALIFRRGLS